MSTFEKLTTLECRQEAVDDATLNRLLVAVNEVNGRFAEEFASQYGVDAGLRVGLTVRDNREVEFWHGNQRQAIWAKVLLEKALQKAGLEGVFKATDGYEFRLLFRGSDY